MCREISKKARILPSFSPLIGAVLGFFSSLSFAAGNTVDYTADVDYDGDLYYEVITPSTGKTNTTCRSAAKGISFSTKNLDSREVIFFTDSKCTDTLSTFGGSELFGNETSVSVTLNKDGSISGAQGATSSSSMASSSASSSNSGQTTNPTKNGSKTIAFFTPWSNTNAILFMNGDSVATMTALKNYCGWFVASVKPGNDSLKVYFKQTIGLNYVSAEGMVQTEPTIAAEISLDSVAALSDTIWVQGYKADVPAQFSKYPGVLGDCPLKKFPVTVYDWKAKGSGTSADFESGGCAGSNATNSAGGKYMKGMVQYNLGANGVPVPSDPFPSDCKITEHLAYWFLPESLAVDKEGNTLTNMTCRDLYISMDDEGFWLAEVSKDNISEGNEGNKGGMFLIDDFKYLDDDNTISNPYYDNLEGNGGKHNFSYTVKIQATFEYVPGQYFDFYGDDDVWVFIDNRLAVDIGGQHTQVAGAVDLDTIGQNTGNKLVPGETYNFQIFYAERHTSQSNFRMHTSIDLKVDASIFVTSEKKGNETSYDVWQVNKKNKLSCINDVNATELDTTGGASTFRLTGGNLSEPEVLGIGTYFEGIKITSDSTFSIDSAAIVSNFTLAPGHYFLEIILKSDPSQTTKIEIVIPSYAIPSVAFAKSDWTILGKEVSGDTLQIGDWAYATYQVNITFFEDWAKVNNYNRKVNLTFSDPNIDILDTVGGKKISYVNLDSNGHATFYVHANTPVTGAILTAKGAAAGASIWTNLNFAEPPIPQVAGAIIVDRNGDGRADSLYAHFDRTLNAKSTLDSIQFTFGEAFVTTTKFTILNGTDIIAVAEKVSPDNCSGDKCGFGTRLFTGSASEIYFGSLNSWFTYTDNGKTSQFYKEDDPIDDGVGPVVVSAVKSKSSDGNRQLALTFSEAIDDETRSDYVKMFELICMRSGVNEKPEDPVQQSGTGNSMLLIYSSSTQDAVLPSNGDLIRFTTTASTVDLAGNAPHKDNPWVTITGDQEMTNESPSIIAVGEDPYGIIRNDTVTQTLLITSTTQSAQQIGDSLGVQGTLIDYDISKIMIEQTQDAVNGLDAFIESRIGSTTTYDTVITSISETEAIAQVFNDIRAAVVDTSYGFSEETINGILDGSITESNYKSKIGTEDQALITSMSEANIEASRDTSITASEISTVTQSDIFEAIRSGKLDEELAEAGVSADLIEAIKNGEVTESNIDDYRNGTKSLVADDAVELFYRTRYYSQFGEYVGGTSKSIKCSDTSVYGEGGCLENKGKLFLAWNMRSNSGRLVATGVYIARLELKIIVNGKTTLHQTRDKLWGVRRGGTNNLGLDL